MYVAATSMYACSEREHPKRGRALDSEFAASTVGLPWEGRPAERTSRSRLGGRCVLRRGLGLLHFKSTRANQMTRTFEQLPAIKKERGQRIYASEKVVARMSRELILSRTISA